MTLIMGSVNLTKNLKGDCMSVLIRGMEMPKSCFSCRFSRITRSIYAWCSLMEKRYSVDDPPPKDCPLIPVPPHGRLGDLDRMLVDNETYYDQLGRPGGVIRTSYMAVKHSIEIAPTIIQAEGENVDVPAGEAGE